MAMVFALVVKRVEAVTAVQLLVDLQIEVRVAIPLVHAAALADDLRDLAPALISCRFVGLLGCLGGGFGFGGGPAGCTLGELVLWDDRRC